jgi:sugar lactone lactonase YvrE
LRFKNDLMNKNWLILLLAGAFIAACNNKGTMVSTFAGNGTLGAVNGKAEEASFSNLMDVAADSAGNLYVADSRNNLIRKVSPDGTVSTLAGSGKQGSEDGKGTAASFFFPAALAADAKGDVFVADTHNSMIRRITPDGTVITIAGRLTPEVAKYRDTVIKLDNPYGIAVDAHGNIFVADWERDMIKKISPDGKVTAFAGNSQKGAKDGKGAEATFYLPQGLALDHAGNLYVADCYNNMIRKITSNGMVSTFAGNVKKGAKDGKGKAASFSHPDGLVVDGAGNVYVADVGNNKIRKITPDGVVSTVAGTGLRGADNGPAKTASFYRPFGITIGKDGSLYVADYQNNLIRKISLK